MEPLFTSVPSGYKDLESELISVTNAASRAGFASLEINVTLAENDKVSFRQGNTQYLISSISDTEFELTNLSSDETWTLSFSAHNDSLSCPDGTVIETSWSAKDFTSSSKEGLARACCCGSSAGISS